MPADTSEFGKYRLLAELGRGGMADVFLAVTHGPGGFSKLHVLKRLRATLADDPDFISMFVDEARIAARLNHPNIVQTNEIGNVGRDYFIAMEYLDGQPLHRVVNRARSRGGIERHMHFSLLADVLGGLHHAHELADYDGSPLQIVHRDVTPHNVFVTYEGQVKVVDFGIAKAVGRMSAETKTGVVKGKVAYMAPEQATSKHVDRRGDIFAVGVMLWEAAIGMRMWKDADDIGILSRLLSGDIPVSPRAVDPDVPEAIDRICRRALAHRPTERYANAAEMQNELEQYLMVSGKRPSQRQVGAFITDLFKDKRLELKDIIEKKLAELKTGEFSAFQPAELSAISRTGDTTKSNLLQNAPNPEEVTKAIFTAQTKTTAAATGRKFGAIHILAGVAVTAAVVATGALVLRPGPDPTKPVPAVNASASPPVHETAPEVVPTPTVAPSIAAPLEPKAESSSNAATTTISPPGAKGRPGGPARGQGTRPASKPETRGTSGAVTPPETAPVPTPVAAKPPIPSDNGLSTRK